jgi:hypothetical protein
MNTPDDDITGYEGGATWHDSWDESDDEDGDICPLCDTEVGGQISAFHQECYFDLGLCPYCDYDANDQSEGLEP